MKFDSKQVFEGTDYAALVFKSGDREGYFHVWTGSDSVAKVAAVMRESGSVAEFDQNMKDIGYIYQKTEPVMEPPPFIWSEKAPKKLENIRTEFVNGRLFVYCDLDGVPHKAECSGGSSSEFDGWWQDRDREIKACKNAVEFRPEIIYTMSKLETLDKAKKDAIAAIAKAAGENPENETNQDIAYDAMEVIENNPLFEGMVYSWFWDEYREEIGRELHKHLKNEVVAFKKMPELVAETGFENVRFVDKGTSGFGGVRDVYIDGWIVGTLETGAITCMLFTNNGIYRSRDWNEFIWMLPQMKFEFVIEKNEYEDDRYYYCHMPTDKTEKFLLSQQVEAASMELTGYRTDYDGEFAYDNGIEKSRGYLKPE